ncbi:hypothetical protein TNCV_2538381 [Trichonephila clavipes]|nr:hypothetical protein TNCV_2538381 [Trichonephila clavipes]
MRPGSRLSPTRVSLTWSSIASQNWNIPYIFTAGACPTTFLVPRDLKTITVSLFYPSKSTLLNSIGESPKRTLPSHISEPQILQAVPRTSFGHHWCGPNNGPIVPDLFCDQGLSNIWAIIRSGNTFPPEGYLCDTPWRQNFPFRLTPSRGTDKNYVSYIVCLEKQASVSHETNERVMTPKSFS